MNLPIRFRSPLLYMCLGIFLVSLLTGCSTPAKTTVPPQATDVVKPVNTSPADTQATPVVGAATNTPQAVVEATATQVSQPVSGSLPDDPMEAFTYSMRKFNTTFPHTTLSDTVAGDTTVEAFVEFGAADVVRMKSPSGSIMFIHEKFYRLVDGKWVEETPQDYEKIILTSNDPANLDEFIKTITSITYVGKETLDGIVCQVYEYTASSDVAGMQSTGKGRVWIAVDTGLPMKQVVESTTGDYSATTTQIIGYTLATPIQP